MNEFKDYLTNKHDMQGSALPSMTIVLDSDEEDASLIAEMDYLENKIIKEKNSNRQSEDIQLEISNNKHMTKRQFENDNFHCIKTTERMGSNVKEAEVCYKVMKYEEDNQIMNQYGQTKKSTERLGDNQKEAQDYYKMFKYEEDDQIVNQFGETEQTSEKLDYNQNEAKDCCKILIYEEDNKIVNQCGEAEKSTEKLDGNHKEAGDDYVIFIYEEDNETMKQYGETEKTNYVGESVCGDREVMKDIFKSGDKKEHDVTNHTGQGEENYLRLKSLNFQKMISNGEQILDFPSQGNKVFNVQDEGHQVFNVQDEGHQVFNVKDEGHQVFSVKDEGHQVFNVKDEGHQVFNVKDEGHQVFNVKDVMLSVSTDEFPTVVRLRTFQESTPKLANAFSKSRESKLGDNNATYETSVSQMDGDSTSFISNGPKLGNSNSNFREGVTKLDNHFIPGAISLSKLADNITNSSTSASKLNDELITYGTTFRGSAPKLGEEFNTYRTTSPKLSDNFTSFRAFEHKLDDNGFISKTCLLKLADNGTTFRGSASKLVHQSSTNDGTTFIASMPKLGGNDTFTASTHRLDDNGTVCMPKLGDYGTSFTASMPKLGDNGTPLTSSMPRSGDNVNTTLRTSVLMLADNGTTFRGSAPKLINIGTSFKPSVSKLGDNGTISSKGVPKLGNNGTTFTANMSKLSENCTTFTAGMSKLGDNDTTLISSMPKLCDNGTAARKLTLVKSPEIFKPRDLHKVNMRQINIMNGFLVDQGISRQMMSPEIGTTAKRKYLCDEENILPVKDTEIYPQAMEIRKVNLGEAVLGENHYQEKKTYAVYFQCTECTYRLPFTRSHIQEIVNHIAPQGRYFQISGIGLTNAAEFYTESVNLILNKTQSDDGILVSFKSFVRCKGCHISFPLDLEYISGIVAHSNLCKIKRKSGLYYCIFCKTAIDPIHLGEHFNKSSKIFCKYCELVILQWMTCICSSYAETHKPSCTLCNEKFWPFFGQWPNQNPICELCCDFICSSKIIELNHYKAVQCAVCNKMCCDEFITYLVSGAQSLLIGKSCIKIMANPVNKECYDQIKRKIVIVKDILLDGLNEYLTFSARNRVKISPHFKEAKVISGTFPSNSTETKQEHSSCLLGKLQINKAVPHGAAQTLPNPICIFTNDINTLHGATAAIQCQDMVSRLTGIVPFLYIYNYFTEQSQVNSIHILKEIGNNSYLQVLPLYIQENVIKLPQILFNPFPTQRVSSSIKLKNPPVVIADSYERNMDKPSLNIKFSQTLQNNISKSLSSEIKSHVYQQPKFIKLNAVPKCVEKLQVDKEISHHKILLKQHDSHAPITNTTAHTSCKKSCVSIKTNSKDHINSVQGRSLTSPIVTVITERHSYLHL